MTPRERMTERDFQAIVLQILRLNGYLAYHTHDSRHSAAGFPDICAVGHGRLIFAELKTETGKLQPAQALWLAKLAEVPGCEVFVWKPGDLRDIERILSRNYVPVGTGEQVAAQ